MVMRSKGIIQVFFLLLFIFMVALGRVQGWMIIFLASVLGAVLFGRFYCGWICPINTVTDIINWLYKKNVIKRREVPNWIKNGIVRYIIFLLFMGTMIFTLKTGKKIPVLPILVIAGSVLTLFFVPQLWHRYLCPYGTLLNITGSFARHFWTVDSDNCIKCGICKQVCPGEAVQMKNKNVTPEINKGLCLQCNACVEACPKKAIKYS